MELEELEVLFKMNTSQIQPMLDKLQSSFQQALGKTADTAKVGMEKTESAMDVSKGMAKVSSQLSKLNETIGSHFNRMKTTVGQGTAKIDQSSGNMFGSTKQKVGQDLDSVLAIINSKMNQAKAAQAKMHDLMNQKSSLAVDQQTGTQGVKFDSQIATAQAQMTRYQTQARALAQSMKTEFNEVPDSLYRISSAMDQNERKINGLNSRLKSLQGEYKDVAETMNLMGNSSKLEKQSAYLEKSMMSVREQINKLVSSNDSLNKSYAYVSDRGEKLKSVVGSLDTTLANNSKMATASSSSMRNMGSSMNEAGGRMRKMGNDGNSSMDKMAAGTRRSYTTLGELVRQVRFLPAMLIVYGLLYQGIMNLASGFMSALKTNTQFSSSLNQIQVNLLTAFYPIYSYILPAINSLMAALSKATAWIAQFVAALAGMSYSAARKGASGLYSQIQAMNDTSSASKSSAAAIKKANEQIAASNKAGAAQVKAANKQITASNKEAQAAFEETKKKNKELAESLMGFDEINVLDKSYGNDSLQAPEKQALQTFTPQDKQTADSSDLSSGTGGGLDFGAPLKQSNNLLGVIQGLKKILGELFDPMQQAWQSKGQKVVDSFKNAWNQILKLLGDVGQSFLHVWDGGTGEKIMANIFDIIANVFNVVGNLAGQFDKAWKHGDIGTSIFKTLLGFVNDFLSALNDMTSATAKWASKIDFTPLLQSIDGLLKAIRPILKDVWDGLDWGYQHVLLPLATFTITDLIPDFFDLISAALKVIGSIINASKPAFNWFWDSFLEPLAKWTDGAIVGVLKTLTNALSGVSGWVDKHQKAVEFIAKTLLQMFTFKVGFGALNTGVGLIGKIADKAVILSGKGNVLASFFGKITGLSSLKEAATNVKTLWSLASMKWEDFAKGVTGMASAIKNWSAWSKIATAAQAAWNAVLAVNPIYLVVAAIAVLVAGLVWFFTQTKTGQKIWSDFIKWLKNAWTDIQKFFVNLWNALAKFFSDIWNGMKTAGSKAWNWISDAFKNTFNGIGSFFRSIWNGLATFWNNIWGGLKSTGSNAWNWIAKTISGVLGGINSGWRSMWNGIGSFFTGVWNGIKSTVKTAMNDVIGFINSGIKGIDSVIHAFGGSKTAIGLIPKFAKGTPGAPKGLAMVNDGGGQEAIIDNQKNVHVLDGENQLVDFEGGETVIPYEASKSLLGNGINHFANGTFGWLSGFGNWIKDKWESITKFISNPVKALQNIAGDTIKSLSGGKSSLVSNIAPALGGGLINGIAAPFKSLLSSFKSKHDAEDESPTGSGVQRWKDTVKKALSKNNLSTSTSMVNRILRQIQTESGGNEKAVQHGYTDANSISGDLAKGLMQVISATFNHYKFSGYGNIFKGYDNLLAALNYAKHRYGPSLSYLGQGHGYANGGLIDKDGMYRVGEGNKPEMVLPLTDTPRAMELIKQAMKFMGQTFGDGLQMPSSLTSETDLNSLNAAAGNQSSNNQVGINQFGSNIVNALVQALQMNTGNLAANNQPVDLNLTVQIGNETIGNAAIKGINEVNQKNGRNMLKL
ncbi:phage tail tape measure protein [Oenococcus oeni]|nr:phage tail tape measure protein [Oenococcus oeni]TEU59053.1 phage tail tape measure protein [Oenococcus oeni]TEU59288.1 phage tail tape measure protein [Oenococcus oeni]